jgi:hypothetical protein
MEGETGLPTSGMLLGLVTRFKTVLHGQVAGVWDFQIGFLLLLL